MEDDGVGYCYANQAKLKAEIFKIYTDIQAGVVHEEGNLKKCKADAQRAQENFRKARQVHGDARNYLKHMKDVHYRTAYLKQSCADFLAESAFIQSL
jgi:hypothetical protein